MTDGERLVWAAAFARVFDRSRNGVHAAREAALAVAALREALLSREPDGNFAVWGRDDRGFLDEIVSNP